jgi:hypothetical protein
MEELDDPDDYTNETPSDTPSDDADTSIIYATNSSGNSILWPGDIHFVISKASKKFVNQCEYFVSKHDHTPNMLLVDWGANGGVAGNDVCVLYKKICVDIKLIDDHQLTDIPIGTVGCVVSTQKVLLLPICITMH